MSAENQTQDFAKLQRLLKLKRHEQPPPRFFNDFSGKVTARLRAGDVGRLESIEDVVAQAPWLRRLWRAIEGRPAVSGAFAAGVCGLLLAGIVFADKAPNALPAFAENATPATEPAQPVLFATSPGIPQLANSSNSLFGMPILEAPPILSRGLPIAAPPR
jgi:hypothetical protein